MDSFYVDIDVAGESALTEVAMFYARICVVILILGLVGCASRGQQAERLLTSARSQLAAGEFVRAVENLLIIIRSQTSPPAVAESKRLVADPKLGKKFEAKMLVDARKMNVRRDLMLLLDLITDFSTYNPYIKERQANLQRVLCREATPKIQSGEIWLTAADGNIAVCLQDRAYVEAIFNNSLVAVGSHDNPLETQALSHLVADVPFPEFAARLKQELPNADTVAKNILSDQRETQIKKSPQAKQSGVAAEAQTNRKPSRPQAKITVLVNPSTYYSLWAELRGKLRSRIGNDYVERPDNPLTTVVTIQVDSSYSSPRYEQRFTKEIKKRECDWNIRNKMAENDEYRFSYVKIDEKETLSGILVINLAGSVAADPFSFTITNEVIKCDDFEIGSYGKKRKRIYSYANNDMEKFCTENKKSMRDSDAMSGFAEIFAEILSAL